MKINKIPNQKINTPKTKKAVPKNEENQEKKQAPAAYFKKSTTENGGHVYDQTTIKRLKAEAAQKSQALN